MGNLLFFARFVIVRSFLVNSRLPRALLPLTFRVFELSSLLLILSDQIIESLTLLCRLLSDSPRSKQPDNVGRKNAEFE
jgi:hypothetical protein